MNILKKKDKIQKICFWPIFCFWPKFLRLIKNFVFDQKFNISPKLLFLSKMTDFEQNFRFRTKTSAFVQHFDFYLNFCFWPNVTEDLVKSRNFCQKSKNFGQKQKSILFLSISLYFISFYFISSWVKIEMLDKRGSFCAKSKILLKIRITISILTHTSIFDQNFDHFLTKTSVSWPKFLYFANIP